MKKYIFILVFPLLIPATTYAIWYNPATWFSSDNSSSEKLLERVSELEKKLSDKTENTVNSVSGTTSISVAETDSITGDLGQELKDANNQIVNLKTKISSLQSKYDICLNSSKKTDVTVSTVSTPASVNQNQSTNIPTQKDTPFAYTKYIKANVSDYVKNPSAYKGWGTEILAVKIDDFLAAGDRGVLNNYVEVTDYSSSAPIPPDKMMILIPSDTDYTSIVNLFEKGDVINVWGIGSPSQQFHTVGSSDLTSSYEPVITVQRMDRCRFSSCADGNTVLLFDKKI